MTQNATPYMIGIDEYLKLEPEHPELAVRIGRCLHKMGELSGGTWDKHRGPLRAGPHWESPVQSAEAEAIDGLVPALAGSDYAVLTPYHAQEKLLTEVMPQNKRARIHTIHSTQGREWDTVVLSVVDSEKPLLMDSQNRAVHGLEVLNTAVSRAKKRLILVCDTTSWQGRRGAPERFD